MSSRSVFVDKSLLVADILTGNNAVTLFCRPRRFGKTLAMAARTNGYYREAVGFLKGWLTGALKDGGAALEFACLTGVQRIAKESIFSDLNNLVMDTPLNKHFDERFGFTEKETQALAAYLGQPQACDELKRWYDGYRFGDVDIYNPWSVLNYFGNGCEPGVYWANTASNAVVGEAVRSSEPDALQDVFRLLEPEGVVWRPLDMAVVFPESGLEGDALWSMLYLAGYLTTDDVEDPTDQYRLRPLRVPDYEIARVFRGEVIERFREVAGGSQRLRALHGFLAAGDAQGVERELARILETSPSCRDMLGENSYHMLMLGLLFGMPGYADPLSNREAGRGYFDVRLDREPGSPRPGHSASVPIVLEFKVLSGREASDDPVVLARSLEELARSVLAQIAAKRYGAPACRSLRYGIAFCGKDVAVVGED